MQERLRYLMPQFNIIRGTKIGALRIKFHAGIIIRLFIAYVGRMIRAAILGADLIQLHAGKLIRLFIATITGGIMLANNKGNGLKIPVQLQPQIAVYSLVNRGGSNV